LNSIYEDAPCYQWSKQKLTPRKLSATKLRFKVATYMQPNLETWTRGKLK